MPFLGKTLDTFSQNPGIQRMPTNQKDWSDFVRNLGEQLAGEEGTFAPTFGAGFSVNPIGALVHWRKVGSLVMMSFYNSSLGTSNSTGFSITGIPEKLTPLSGVQFSVPIVGLVDNGTESWGSVTVTAANTIVFGYEDTQAATWTGSGSKGWNASGSTMPTIFYDTKPTLITL